MNSEFVIQTGFPFDLNAQKIILWKKNLSGGDYRARIGRIVTKKSLKIKREIETYVAGFAFLSAG